MTHNIQSCITCTCPQLVKNLEHSNFHHHIPLFWAQIPSRKITKKEQTARQQCRKPQANVSHKTQNCLPTCIGGFSPTLLLAPTVSLTTPPTDCPLPTRCGKSGKSAITVESFSWIFSTVSHMMFSVFHQGKNTGYYTACNKFECFRKFCRVQGVECVSHAPS